MRLFDGEFERGLELEPGFGFAAEFEVKFPEKNARHHPVRFFGDAELEVLDRVDESVLRDQSLREAEAEELVVRLASDEGSESLGAVHAEELSEVVDKHQHAGGVVQTSTSVREIDDFTKNFGGL